MSEMLGRFPLADVEQGRVPGALVEEVGVPARMAARSGEAKRNQYVHDRPEFLQLWGEGGRDGGRNEASAGSPLLAAEKQRENPRGEN